MNLAALGAERLAEILVAAAANWPELKRKLRMELAAAQGADHLLTEIDKRLGSLETSRSKVSWRQRPTFVRDLDGLRILIAGRLAGLDGSAALDRGIQTADTAEVRFEPGTDVRDLTIRLSTSSGYLAAGVPDVLDKTALKRGEGL